MKFAAMFDYDPANRKPAENSEDLILMSDKPEREVFKVIADGREYMIYADGRVSGFTGESVIVVNNLSSLQAEAVGEYQRAVSK